MSRATHDRTELHSGIDSDLVELLTDQVGTLPAGTDLHTALAYIHNWISLRETISFTIHLISVNAIVLAHRTGSFTANAIKRTQISGSFTGNAVVRKTQSFSLTADSVIKRTISGSFTADAVVRLSGLSFTIDAIIKRAVSGSFTADAVVIAGGMTALKWRSFDQTVAAGNVLPDPPMIRLYNKDHFR